jgi:hypothetical protein
MGINMLAPCFNIPNKVVTFALVLPAALACFAGCNSFQRGGGSRSVKAGNTNTKAVYGIGVGLKLEFLIVTDIDSDGTVASAGSTWAGEIAPPQGKKVTYRATGDGLDINGTQYDYGSGRVFLVSNKDEKITVTQLDVAIGDADYDDEVDRIIEMDQVQEFLNPGKEEGR